MSREQNHCQNITATSTYCKCTESSVINQLAEIYELACEHKNEHMKRSCIELALAISMEERKRS